MEIHYIQPHMKSPYDSIEIKGSEAFISIWRDLPPEPDPAKIECVGYQWLLTGRGQKLGLGAAEIFKKFPDLKRITLNFVEVSFKTDGVDDRGKLKKSSKIHPYFSVSSERSKILSYKPHQNILKKNLAKNNNACVHIGRQMVNDRKLKL